MTGSLWEGADGTVFYVLERAAPHAWRVIDLSRGALDFLWVQNERMRRIDTFEWLQRVET